MDIHSPFEVLTKTWIKKIIRECLQDFEEERTTQDFNNSLDPLQLITVEEVCHLLQLSKPTIYRLIKKGSLQPLKLSKGSLRFRRVDIEDFLNTISVK